MIGVVLWADQIDHKAVIWCEDHGNLAFLKAQEMQNMDVSGLDAGDVIQFELQDESPTRLATNPKRLAMGEYPMLAEALTHQAANSAPELAEPTAADQVADNVIAFPSP